MGKGKLATTIMVIAVIAYGTYVGFGDIIPSFETTQAVQSVSTLGEIPEYDGNLYVEVNNNEPTFTDEDKERLGHEGYEYYSALDSLGRCGYAEANISFMTMPIDEERESISSVHPSGWQKNMKWERCHLIGWQLTGENANDHNLVTGCYTLNHKAMLPFENEVAEYAKNGGHVMYRVTPIFDGNELICRGVHMMAQSVEDDSISFNVYCFNNEPGKTIDYMTGVVK